MARRPRFSPSQFFLLRHRLYDLAQAPNRQNIVIVGTVGALPPVIGWATAIGGIGIEPFSAGLHDRGKRHRRPKAFLFKGGDLVVDALVGDLLLELGEGQPPRSNRRPPWTARSRF
jgi:hypothetical protein